jgi:lambda repressor-like predicted transcriptional regulator
VLRTDNFPHWPASARAIAEALGLEKTIRLHEALAGQRHYIPATGPMPLAIAEVLGEADAERLRQVLRQVPGKQHHDFVRGANCDRPARNAEIVAAHAAGVPVTELARRYGLHTRTLRSVIAASKRPGP